MKSQPLRRTFPFAVSSAPDRVPLVIAFTFVILAFLLAGSSRDDIVSLLFWRPLTAFLLAISIVVCGRQAWQRGRSLVILAAAILLFVASHLIPLPPEIWTSLPGREILVKTYQAAGMALPWQPLSMAQARTWNALFSLAGPIALLIVALALDRRRHQQLLMLFLVLGFVSGIIGMLQALGPANSPLYLYRLTNPGLSVGLFANRNHQAAMLATMFPLLAAYISLFKGRPDRLFFQRSMTLAGACLLIPLILMTGSRAGLILAVAGIVLAWWVYHKPVSQGRVVGIRAEHRSRLVGVGFAVALLVIVLIVAVTTPALQRLIDTDPASELRVQAFPVILEATKSFFPFGSGVGTFVEAYKIFEPDSFVSVSYFNHAHNDLAEIVMTGGLPAVVLVIWVVVLGAIAFFALMRRRKLRPDDADYSVQIMGRAGFAVLAILALGSLADYPLRVPSLALYAVVAAAWCSNAYRLIRK